TILLVGKLTRSAPGAPIPASTASPRDAASEARSERAARPNPRRGGQDSRERRARPLEILRAAARVPRRLHARRAYAERARDRDDGVQSRPGLRSGAGFDGARLCAPFAPEARQLLLDRRPR